MKRFLSNLFLAIFITVGFAGQSWAMGKVKKHSHGGGDQGYENPSSKDNGGNHGGYDSSDLSQGLETQSWHSGQDNNDYPSHDSGNKDNDDDLTFFSGDDSTTGIPFLETNQNDNNPPDPNDWSDDFDQTALLLVSEGDNSFSAPEPMTLSLMGMGLMGIFLKRRKSSNDGN